MMNACKILTFHLATWATAAIDPLLNFRVLGTDHTEMCHKKSVASKTIAFSCLPSFFFCRCALWFPRLFWAHMKVETYLKLSLLKIWSPSMRLCHFKPKQMKMRWEQTNTQMLVVTDAPHEPAECFWPILWIVLTENEEGRKEFTTDNDNRLKAHHVCLSKGESFLFVQAHFPLM